MDTEKIILELSLSFLDSEHFKETVKLKENFKHSTGESEQHEMAQGSRMN
jgi:hypothetical protein